MWWHRYRHHLLFVDIVGFDGVDDDVAFDFELKHVAGTRHGGPDALSRRSGGSDSDDEEEDDIEEVMDAALSVLFEDNSRPRAVPELSVSNEEVISDEAIREEIPDNFRRVIQYLTKFERPEGLTRIQRYATGFLLRDGMLFKRSKPNISPKRVIWDKEERNEIIRKLHDENGHRGRQGTYSKVALRYWWPGQYRDVEAFVRSCVPCQKRKPGQYDEELHPTLYSALWRKVGLDVVHMPKNAGFGYLVAMRYDFSGWLEAKAIRRADAKTIAAFIYEWFVRFGVPGRSVRRLRLRTQMAGHHCFGQHAMVIWMWKSC